MKTNPKLLRLLQLEFERGILYNTIDVNQSLKEESERKEIIDEINNILENKQNLDTEINSGSERCMRCHSKILNYTKIGGGKRSNCCDYNVHFNKCEHGDCDCECHILQQNQNNIEQRLEKMKTLISEYVLGNMMFMEFVAKVQSLEKENES